MTHWQFLSLLSWFHDEAGQSWSILGKHQALRFLVRVSEALAQSLLTAEGTLLTRNVLCESLNLWYDASSWRPYLSHLQLLLYIVRLWTEAAIPVPDRPCGFPRCEGRRIPGLRCQTTRLLEGTRHGLPCRCENNQGSISSPATPTSQTHGTCLEDNRRGKNDMTKASAMDAWKSTCIWVFQVHETSGDNQGLRSRAC